MSQPTLARSVVNASVGYYATQFALAVAGLVSLPITTRLLPKAEYGTLSLVLAAVGVGIVVGQMGFPQAATRFYAESRAQGRDAVRRLFDAMLGGSLSAATTVAAVVALSVWARSGLTVEHARCFRLAALLIVTRVTLNVLAQFYRAQERVAGYATLQVVTRYATIGAAVVLLLWRDATAYSVLLASVGVEALVATACFVELRTRGVVSRPRTPWVTLAAAAAYGVPLVAAGGASFILDYADRFLIEHYFGLESVATYVVPYDLAQNLAVSLFTPVRLAVIPIIFRLWTTDGQEATSEFLSRLFSYVVALSLVAGTLYLIMSRDLILLLASEKYADSAGLSIYLLPGVLMGEMNFLLASGLTIRKNTTLLAVNVLAVGVLNLILNLLLLPRLGLYGAAVATTISYTVLMLATYILTRPVLRLRLYLPPLIHGVVATGLMAVLLGLIGSVSSQRAIDVLARSAIGASAAAICILFLDHDLRRQVSRAIGRTP